MLQKHQVTRVVNSCDNNVAEQPVTQTTTPTAPDTSVVQAAPDLRLDILFDTNKSVIKPVYQEELAKAAAFINQYKDSHIVIEGHTDDQASNAYNLTLSQRRADAVKNALIQQYGISSERLSAVGYGEERPVADNTSAEGRQQNRRVMLVVAP